MSPALARRDEDLIGALNDLIDWLPPAAVTEKDVLKLAAAVIRRLRYEHWYQAVRKLAADRPSTLPTPPARLR